MIISTPSSPSAAEGIKAFRAADHPVKAPPPSVASPVRTLGILFVHGIGDQQRGRTLTQFGEPLFNCLEKWLRHHGGGAELAEVMLRGNPGAPAHAQVRLWHEGKPEKETTTSEPSEETAEGAGADASTRVETKWVLAESNWADAFERPGFESVAFWSIRVVPWFILTQFTDQLAGDLRNERFGRALFSFGYLVLTFPLALLIQLVVLLLVPMSLLAPLRPIVAPIQRWISGVIGDTYVLLNSRFQFQAMVSKVQQDIEWLSWRCDVMAVVAHSQGAAVAHEAVRQAREPKLERLITFGSAVARLKALRRVLDHAPGMLTASSLVTLTVLVLAGLYLWSLLATGGSFFSGVMGVWTLGILLALAAYIMPFTLKDINEQCHETQEFGLSAPAEWEDYYATSDPVPNGRMLASGNYTGRIAEVHNRANVFRDHSSYWRNQDQFGIAILSTLMTLTRGPFKSTSPVWTSGYKRAYRAQILVAARLAALAVAGLALFQHPFFMSGMDLPLWLQVPVGWLAGLVNWVIALAIDAVSLVATKLRLMATAFAAPQIPTPVKVLSWPVACGLLMVLWYVLSTGILRWWEKAETQDCYRGTSRTAHPRRAWWSAFCILTIAWLGFWITWLSVNPADVWNQVAGRFKSAGQGSENSWMVWLAFLLYQFVEGYRKSRESQRELPGWGNRSQRDIIRSLREAETGAADLKSPYYLPQPRDYLAGYTPTEPPKPPSLWETVAEVVRGFLETLKGSLHSLGERQLNWGTEKTPQRLSGSFAAGLSAFSATCALAVMLLHIKVQGVLQAGLGLISLSFGVLGLVRGRNRTICIFAALGIVIGVMTMPAVTALSLGFKGVAAAGLLALGALAAGCALFGAIWLRRGWADLKREGTDYWFPG